MKLKRVRAAGGDCEGCFFHLSNLKKGLLRCSKSTSSTYVHIDCVEYATAVVSDQLVYYIFKEIPNEKQNKTVAPRGSAA